MNWNSNMCNKRIVLDLLTTAVEWADLWYECEEKSSPYTDLHPHTSTRTGVRIVLLSRRHLWTYHEIDLHTVIKMIARVRSSKTICSVSCSACVTTSMICIDPYRLNSFVGSDGSSSKRKWSKIKNCRSISSSSCFLHEFSSFLFDCVKLHCDRASRVQFFWFAASNAIRI